MRKSVIVFGMLLALVSCKKVNLNDLAFPSTKLEAYQFEAFDGPEVLPAQYAIDPANRTHVTMQSKDVQTGESFTIYGVYIGDISTIATDTVILYLHGQSDHMDLYYTRASVLANVGGKHNFGVFMIDYRGFGLSEGSSTERGLYEDTDAAINWLIAQGATPEKTYYYGFSLGAIPSINRAAERTDFKPRKIMLESPLASVENLVHSSTLINVAPNFVTTLEFNNAEKIKQVTCPLLWFHGKEDTYIAIQNGELIYANHQQGEKVAYRIDGADHSEVPWKMGIEPYLTGILNFMRQ